MTIKSYGMIKVTDTVAGCTLFYLLAIIKKYKAIFLFIAALHALTLNP